MRAQRVLVVDDESAVRQLLVDLLSDQGHSVLGVGSLLQARQALQDNKSFDVLFCDVKLGDGNGIDFLNEVRQQHADMHLIVITGFGDLDTAVKSIRIGVFDYLTKPVDAARLEVAMERVMRFAALEQENTKLREELVQSRIKDIIWGQSEQMQRIKELTLKVGKADTTVLISGESGVGKEVISQALHAASPRSEKPYISVNCAAVPANLLESEFFGHEKGAFTGAVEARKGRFEQADGGTLLLDEISEITPELQVKLLRVIQEQIFERVGGNKSRKVDVRLLATTNRNLKEEVKKGNFREDLYYRLNVVPIEVPPLRHRGEDVLDLAQFFINRYGHKHGRNISSLSTQAKQKIVKYPWPGNVRELQNTLERSIILAPDTSELDDEHLVIVSDTQEEDSLALDQLMTLEEMECIMVRRALELCRGNRTHAAKKLGISLRTMRNKLAHYREKGQNMDDVGKLPMP
ncbi:MAG: sigma-54 dependent transcriptional regulator [Verrucomicrobiota bacterium]